MVDEAKRAGIKRIVKVSVFGAAEESFTFARWHRGGGEAHRSLRPGLDVPAAGRLHAELLQLHGRHHPQGGDLLHGDGTEGRGAHIDARDIGAVAARVLTGTGHEGKAYELTGSEAHQLRRGGAGSCPRPSAGRSST